VTKNARRFLAVNPLVAPPYQALGRAGAEQNDLPVAIGAYRTLLLLDPADPVDAHFKLAQWLHRTGDAEAKRQVLEALEDAPRYRAALDLLMEINRTAPVVPAAAAPTAPASPRL
jgi:cytochrome c-type biogenesis protein CcmH/NrfG